MTKSIGSKVTLIGRMDLVPRLPSTAEASGSGKGLFVRIPWDRLAGRMTGIWRHFRRGSAPEEPPSANRTENLQRLDDIRSKAYADIHRNIS